MCLFVILWEYSELEIEGLQLRNTNSRQIIMIKFNAKLQFKLYYLLMSSLQYSLQWSNNYNLKKMCFFVLQHKVVPLHVASRHGQAESVKTLVEAGADLNLTTKVN